MAGCECDEWKEQYEIGNLIYGDTGWARAYADTRYGRIVYKTVKDNRCPWCDTFLMPPEGDSKLAEEAGDEGMS